MNRNEAHEDLSQHQRLTRDKTLLRDLRQLENHIGQLTGNEKEALALELKPLFAASASGSLHHDRVREKALMLLVGLGATKVIEHVAATDRSGHLRGEAKNALVQMQRLPQAANDDAKIHFQHAA